MLLEARRCSQPVKVIWSVLHIPERYVSVGGELVAASEQQYSISVDTPTEVSYGDCRCRAQCK